LRTNSVQRFLWDQWTQEGYLDLWKRTGLQNNQEINLNINIPCQKDTEISFLNNCEIIYLVFFETVL